MIADEAVPGRPLDIVTACRAADFPILRLTHEALRRFVPFKKLHVITAARNFPRLKSLLAGGVELHDEDLLIPGMTLAQLRELPLPGFPKGAGWYFQQLLKLAFCFREPENDYYLIWDADTVPLRPLEFFDVSGRMLLTRAEEEHPPYFETYRRLLQEEPRRKFSFIAQHMIVQKSLLREMLARIEGNFPGDDSWAWKIMRHLEGSSTNLFSEYETLGCYLKNNHPERVAFRDLRWLREGSLLRRGLPRRTDLEQLAAEYDYVAFESAQRGLRRIVRQVRRWCKAAPLNGLG